MRKLILLLMVLASFGCSAPMPGEDVGDEPGVEDVVQQALTVCSTTGSSGTSAWPPKTVVTGIKVAPNFFGRRLLVTACDIVGSFCDTSVHEFFNIHWHEINGDWVGSKQWPLRRIAMRPPGCYLQSPNSYCMSMYGDNDAGTHVNELQNSAMFWFDAPASASPVDPFNSGPSILAPFGTGIAKLHGGLSPSNLWRVRLPNATNTGMATKDLLFNSAGCP